jgi:kynurenine formamidase
MNTVLTLNTHVGTHIDAPRHVGGAGLLLEAVDSCAWWRATAE